MQGCSEIKPFYSLSIHMLTFHMLTNTPHYFISTYGPPVPHSRVGWIKQITGEQFHYFTDISSGSLQETNLRGYMAQEVDWSIC